MSEGLPVVLRGGQPHEVEAFKTALNDFVMSALDDRRVSTHELARLYATSVTAYTAANLRAEAVSLVPYRVIDRQGTHQPDHPLSQMLARTGLRDLIQRSELAMCFWGHNLLYKRRGHGGRVVSLRWMNPQLYTPREDWHYGLIGFDIRRVSRAVLPAFITRTDGVYMFGVDFDDDYDGVAPAEAAFRFAGVETEGALTMLSFFRNRAIPFAIVQPEKEAANPPDERTQNKLVTFLREVAKGARNVGKTFVSPGRWEWVQLQQKFEEIGLEPVFVQARIYVSMAFRVPLEMLIPSEATYASAYQADAGWVNHWLKPRCSWYAEQLTTQLASEYGDGVRLEPDYSEILREDEQRQTEVANAQVQGGYLSLYDAQVRTRVQKPDDRLKGIYVIGGLPMTAEAIVELAQRPQAAPVYPGGNGTGGDGTQLLPASALPTKLPPQPVSQSARAALVLDPDPDDVALQPTKQTACAVQQSGLDESPSLDPDDSAWLPETVFKELRDCVRVVARKGADYGFQAETLPIDVVAYVRLLVALGDDEADSLLMAARSYLQTRQDLVALRAYADIERTYRAALYDLIRAAFARRVNRTEFGDLGRAEVSTAYEAAFKQGLADVGVPVDRLEGGEAAFVKEQAKAERRYWTHLADDVFGRLLPLVEQIQTLTEAVHATGDPTRQQELRAEILRLKKQLIASRDQVLGRLDLWMQSLRRLYSQGQLSGGRNQMLLWEADLAAENCRTCRAAHGQIHRASKWAEFDLHPGADVLECVHFADGVPVCKCGFRVVTDKARGNIRRIPLFAATRSDAGHQHALRAEPATEAGYIALYVAGVDTLATIQQQLDEVRSDWDPMPVDLFHITLAYAERMSHEDMTAVIAALQDQPVPTANVTLREINCFENEGERAIVALADVDEAVRVLQRQVVEVLTARGVELSDHSQPETWQPHITLGYEWADTPPFEPYAVSTRCVIDRLAISRDNYYTVYEKPAGVGEVDDV
jgi:phage portal protein BeeE/2'-5' RNA ligase